MNFFAVFMAVFSVLGGIDRLLGNRFGLGEQFEKGFQLLGSVVLSMVGMIVLAPFLAQLMEPAFAFLQNGLHLDPSILPASLFANDMGGQSLAYRVALTPEMGRYNGLIVSALMGVTISFTIPVALTLVKPHQHGSVLMGFLCGIITAPIGCFLGGLFMGLSVWELLKDLLPLLIFSGILSLGILKAPKITVRIFQYFGKFIRLLVGVGLLFGIVEFLTGMTPGVLEAFKVGADISVNACVVMSGAFPFMHLLSKLLKKPLQWLGSKLGVNSVAAMGFLSSLATSVTTFGTMEDMDDKGIVLNSAFAVCAAFTFASHLAYTMTIDATVIPPMILAKLTAGICAVGLAMIIYKRNDKKELGGTEHV